jgi:hypothetical protein
MFAVPWVVAVGLRVLCLSGRKGSFLGDGSGGPFLRMRAHGRTWPRAWRAGCNRCRIRVCTGVSKKPPFYTLTVFQQKWQISCRIRVCTGVRKKTFLHFDSFSTKMTDFLQNSCLHWSQEKKKNFLHFGLVLKTRGQCYDHYFCRFWQFFNKNAVPFKSIHTYMLWIFLC